MSYRLIVFDWDGTLVDSIGRIVSCFRACFERHGAPYPGDDAVKRWIGIPLRDACQALMPKAGDDFLDAFVASYRDVWLDPATPLAPLFPGVADLLAWLDGCGHRLAVATGKARAGLERELAHHRLAAWFEAVRCAEDAHPKPHPDMLRQLMTTTGATPRETLMVGDTAMDLEMAARAGADGAAVLTGGHSRARLSESAPRVYLERVVDLRQFLQGRAAV